MKKITAAVLCLASLALTVCASSVGFAAQTQSQSAEDAVAFLTNGVDEIPPRGLPGPIVSLGENSFPVVLGKYQGSALAPLVSASFVQKGRVLAFGHTDYCNAEAISATESTKRFFKNAVIWASGNTKASPASIRVAVWRNQNTAAQLKDLGFNAKSVDNLNEPFDVFIAGAVALNDQQYAKLFGAIQDGAGFVTCGLGWGWSQLNPGKDLPTDHAGNRNFAKYNVGLAWASDSLETTKEKTFAVSKESVAKAVYVNGANVVNFISKLAKQPADAQKLLNEKDKDDLNQLSSTLALTLPFLPDEKLEIIDQLASGYSEEIVLTDKSPALPTDLLKRLVITIQTERYLHDQSAGRIAPEDVPALPAAASFPGEVPADAKRLNDVSVMVKTAVPDWTSTGLYAAPGEVITVKIAQEQFAKFPKPFKIRIGSHSDSIKHVAQWTRYPEITLEKTITSPETKIANPFGGLVYIVVPRNIGSAGLGLVEFKISGAVASPRFIRDVTSLDEWKELRENPAPWAEIQGNNVIVTVPSADVRTLDNPQQLAETWDEILALEAEFAGGPYVRERPERICCDRKISAGYMHSGYPVMTHMDVEKDLVDNDRLRKDGDWGFYHEFGHNHQSSYWTFEGSVEVTVNYFTLYIMENFNGRRAEFSKNDLTKEAQARMMEKYFRDGANFEDWKKNPFLALLMTIQMRNDLGWEPFLRTISEYRKAPADELPKNDQEKRDQWMVRMSRNSGKNLGPFFMTWGVPVSQSALDSIKDLPIWFPEELIKYTAPQKK